MLTILKYVQFKVNHLNHGPLSIPLLMPQSHPNTGPVGFLASVRFLARKAEWSAHKVLHQCCSCGHIRLDTAVNLWFDRIIHKTPHRPRAMPVWVSYGPARGSPMFFISYGITAWHNQNLQQSRTGNVCCRTGPVRAPCGQFMGCLPSLNPYRSPISL